MNQSYITQESLEKLFRYIKGLNAYIDYEDEYDYSAGIKGASVEYTPETVDELANELQLYIITKESILQNESEINVLKMENNQLSSGYDFFESSYNELRAINSKLIESLEQIKYMNSKEYVFDDARAKALEALEYLTR